MTGRAGANGVPLRVIQWATGNIGSRALREVIRDLRLELVGLRVYDPEKVGVDAGEFVGEGSTGVTATDDRDALVALGADCVLYMPRIFDLDDVVAFLEAGTNVVATRDELCGGGRHLSDEDRTRLLDACRRGNSSAFATGSSPGFITETLPFALLSLQRHVDSVEIDEFANMSRRDSPHMIFKQMGFGRPPEAFNPNRSSHLLAAFSPSLELLAAAADRPIESWTCHGEVAAATRDVTLAAGELAAGTVGAQRTVLTGSSGGSVAVKFTANWYCTTDLDPAWELGATGWRVQVHGDAPMDVALPFPIPLDDLGAYTPGYTANPPVNAIPYVYAAAPGILATTDLPPITPAGPIR